MTIAPSRPGWLTWPGWLRVLGGALLLCGGAALAGRMFGVDALMSIVPGSSRIPTASAVLLLLLGGALWQAAADRGKFARVCGWLVAVFSALIIVSRLAGDIARPDVLLGRLLTSAAPVTGFDQVGATASISLMIAGLIVVSLTEAVVRPPRIAVLSGSLLGLTLLTLLKHATGLEMALPGGLQFGLAIPVMAGLLLLAITGLVGAVLRTTASQRFPTRWPRW
jgi:hypothetical protein